MTSSAPFSSSIPAPDATTKPAQAAQSDLPNPAQPSAATDQSAVTNLADPTRQLVATTPADTKRQPAVTTPAEASYQPVATIPADQPTATTPADPLADGPTPTNRNPEAWNPTIACQTEHRSIRFFTDQAIAPDQLAALEQVVERTATSCGLSFSSVIKITDPALKAGISKLARQPYQATAPQLWVFLVDAYRAGQILAEQGLAPALAATMDTFFQGYSDACLTAQNVATAAESLGLGTCFLGSILNDPQATIELLQLPPRTFPALGIMFGYPAKKPSLKPHLPNSQRVFENQYQRFEHYTTQLHDYDSLVTDYYRGRGTRPLGSFTQQTVQRMQSLLETRKTLLKVVAQQGFSLGLD